MAAPCFYLHIYERGSEMQKRVETRIQNYKISLNKSNAVDFSILLNALMGCIYECQQSEQDG